MLKVYILLATSKISILSLGILILAVMIFPPFLIKLPSTIELVCKVETVCNPERVSPISTEKRLLTSTAALKR